MPEYGPTVFGKILRKEIPADFIYEDEHAVAFFEVHPAAPVHFLVLSKKPIPRLSESTDDDKQLLGHLLCVARYVANEQKLDHGYRVVIKYVLFALCGN